LLTEAAAHVMVNGLPATAEDLYLALSDSLKRCPARTVAMEILAPFHRRMKAALKSGN
jgi:hypothetical protein